MIERCDSYSRRGSIIECQHSGSSINNLSDIQFKVIEHYEKEKRNCCFKFFSDIFK